MLAVSQMAPDSAEYQSALRAWLSRVGPITRETVGRMLSMFDEPTMQLIAGLSAEHPERHLLDHLRQGLSHLEHTLPA